MQELEELRPVSDEILTLFDLVCGDAEAEVKALCSSHDGQIAALGRDAETMIESGLGYVSNILRAAMRYSEGEILKDELERGRERLPGYIVSPEIVHRNFERYKTALENRMPARDFAAIRPYLDMMMTVQQSIVANQ
jgi:hypothetical protein